MIGETIGRYEIVERLGSGGMGDVFLGVEPSIGRQVAIKLLKLNLNPKERLRFLKEGEILAQLQHPTIVHLEEHSEHPTLFGKRPYIIMQLMKNSLREVLDNTDGPLMADKILEVVDRVSSGLSFIHAHKIVHRDLKPSNIFFDEAQEAFIGDFGIAKVLESETLATSGVLGTPYYMSPEQVNNRGVDHRSDIYSFGCVVFEMLTGQAPFSDLGDYFTIMEAHRSQPLPLVSDLNEVVPWQVSKVIDKATRKDPNQRYQSVIDFASDLLDAMKEEAYLGEEIVFSDLYAQDLDTSLTADYSADWGQPAPVDNEADEDDTIGRISKSIPTSLYTNWFVRATFVMLILAAALFLLGTYVINNLGEIVLDSSTTTALQPTLGEEGQTEEHTEPVELTKPDVAPALSLTPTLPIVPIILSPVPTRMIVPAGSVKDVQYQIEDDLTVYEAEDYAVFSAPQNKWIRITTNQEKFDVLLPNKTNLHMMSNTMVQIPAGDSLVIDVLRGFVLIENSSGLAEGRGAGKISAESSRGELGIGVSDDQNGVIEIDCFSGVCNYQASGGERIILSEERGVTLSMAGSEIVDRPLSHVEYGKDPPTPTPEPTIDSRRIFTQTIGPTAQKTPIEVVRLGTGERVLLLVGGIHAGFAPNSVAVVDELISVYTESMDEIPENVSVYIVRNLNPDAEESAGEPLGRLNSRGVDLNRNWDCRWRQDSLLSGRTITNGGGQSVESEKETQALVTLIQEIEPDAVIFWGATIVSGGFVTPGLCEADEAQVSSKLSTLIHEQAGYPILDGPLTVDYNLTGDASNWLNREGIPAVFNLLYNFKTYDIMREKKAVDATIWAVSNNQWPEANVDDDSLTPTPALNIPLTCGDYESRWMESLYIKYRPDLGCPLNDEMADRAASQSFANGMTFWRGDTNEIYFFNANGTLFKQSMNGIPNLSDYERTDFIKGGIGWVYDNAPGAAQQMGLPLEPEQFANTYVGQTFQYGAIFSFDDKGRIRTFVVLDSKNLWIEEAPVGN